MKALTIGGAMVDTIAIIDSERVERMTMRNAELSFLLLEEGRKTEASEISTHCGGGAINSAVAMARLGLDVAALVKLGRDGRAEMILRRLEDEKISSRWALRDVRAPTGAAVMIASHDRNAAVFTFRGANTLLEPDDLKPDAFMVDLVYVTGLSNQSADRFPEIVERAKAARAFLATNPGIRQLSARQGAFHDCVGRIDLLAINRIEADTLVPGLVARFGEGGGMLPFGEGEEILALAARGLEAGGFEMSLPAFCAALHHIGLRWLVITDGPHGAWLSGEGRIMHCPVYETPVVGTAGAGDAFSSTLAAMLARETAPDVALQLASINAASVISFADTQTGLLPINELKTRHAVAAKQLAIRSWSV